MLIIRMQAYAYENIIGRNQDKADAIADEILGDYDHMLEANPYDSAGFWAGTYYNRFVSFCEQI